MTPGATSTDMTGRVAGKVALITGAARGQGRAHAVRLAEEGADIIAIDALPVSDVVAYDPATLEDLAETVALVERTGQRVITSQADVRDLAALEQAVDLGVAELGRLDIVVANAGIQGRAQPIWEMSPAQWDEVVGTNLTGVWNTLKATVPTMIEGGRGGSIILTSSTAGIRGFARLSDYTASKTGVVGLMRAMMNELGEYRIRVNTIHPTATDTPMLHSDELYALFMPDSPTRTREEYADVFSSLHALPVPWADPVDQANGVLFLASDEARYVTGVELKIDAGFCR